MVRATLVSLEDCSTTTTHRYQNMRPSGVSHNVEQYLHLDFAILILSMGDLKYPMQQTCYRMAVLHCSGSNHNKSCTYSIQCNFFRIFFLYNWSISGCASRLWATCTCFTEFSRDKETLILNCVSYLSCFLAHLKCSVTASHYYP